MLQLKQESRQAIRDAVNRGSRKPFFWGGLAGYHQLEAIRHALAPLPELDRSGFFQRLLFQLNRALENNRQLASNLEDAHQGLLQIADCLNYPPNSPAHRNLHFTREQVAANIDQWIASHHPDPVTQRPQNLVFTALRKRWKFCREELLPCYDIPGLPQDNLQLESLFENLRRRQRRISGRKSTRELADFAQAQVLFRATSQASLLEQLRQVPLQEYYAGRARLNQAERPRQFLQALHHDPRTTMNSLVAQFLSHCTFPTPDYLLMPLASPP